ncbi:MAG: S41 family peptidase [Lachnospirales bacterium]
MNNKVKMVGIAFAGILTGVVVSEVVRGGFTTALRANDMLSEVSYEEKIGYIHELIQSEYIFEYDEKTLNDSMVEGYVYGLGDPYSTYFTEDEYTKFMESTEGEYVGIGCVVTVDPDDRMITIVSPFKNSPAEKAGIKAGDKVVSVDGLEVEGDDLDLAISMMKGEENTDVVVGILSRETGEVKEVTITRQTIEIITVEHEMLDNNIGYIELTSFDEVTDEQFNEAYEDLINQGAESLILDVRNNPGGLLDVVSNIADTLVPEGVIVSTEDKKGNVEEIKSDAKQVDVPLVMLVNENSASASEVLAGAVKDYGVGTLVGETTFGKGIVQRLYPIGDGTAIKLTISEYFTPSGYALHGKGIEPDVVVDVSDEDSANANYLEHDEDEQLQKAIEILSE